MQKDQRSDGFNGLEVHPMVWWSIQWSGGLFKGHPGKDKQNKTCPAKKSSSKLHVTIEYGWWRSEKE